MGMNVTRRVSFRGGWIGLFSGESQGKALERELRRLNDDGYRVVFIVADRWNLFLRFIWLLLSVLTLGIWAKQQNLLLIGERVAGAVVQSTAEYAGDNLLARRLS